MNMEEVNKYKAALIKAADKIKELDVEVKSLKESHEIAIIGYHCRFPGGANSPQLFWEKLMQGFDAVTEVKADRFKTISYFSENPEDKGKMHTKYASFLDFDIKTFDNTHFEISAAEAVSLDPQQRLLLEVSWEALETAGLDINQLRGSKTGVFVGIDEVDYINREVFSGNPEDMGAYSAVGVSSHAAAGRLSYFYDFKGPSMAVNTACSSSLAAMSMAVDSLRNRQCDLAVVAGANLMLNPEPFIGLSQFHALSPDGRCKTFDASADGFGRGEGCGVILLKRAAEARRDHNEIEALVRSIYVGQDGKSNGFFAPNGLGEQRVIQSALQQAGLKVEDIDYIETHGTGTALGDFIETQAICEVFKQRQEPILIGAVKSNIGHLEAAAGMAGVIKVLLALKYQVIPPSIHFNHPNPDINWDKVKVVDQVTKWLPISKKRRAGVSAFGISGTLVHVILEESECVNSPFLEKIELPVSLLTISTKNKNSLLEGIAGLRDFMNRSPEKIGNIAYSSNVIKDKNEYRFAASGDTREKLIEQMDAVLQDEKTRRFYLGRAGNKRKKLAFLFTGQGSIYPSVAQEFYCSSPAFRDAFSQCDQRFRELLGISIIDELYHQPSEQLINALYSQPIIFSLEYSLTKIWDTLDIVPDYVIGHSVGEYAALCYNGMLSFQDVTSMIAVRSKLMASVKPNGKMVGVLIEEEQMQKAILKSGCRNVSIAAINGPKNITISGLMEEVDQVIAVLHQEERVFVNDLALSYPYHSVVMKDYSGQYGDSLNRIKCHKSTVKVISSVTGTVEDTQLFENKSYWTRHLENTVQFKAAMEQADQLGVTVFIEIGGTATLCGLAGQCIPNEQAVFVPTLRNGVNSYRQLAESLKQLYITGMKLNWNRFYEPYDVKRISLPSYPFDRKTYWKDCERKPQSNYVKNNPTNFASLLDKQNQQLQEQRCLLGQILG